MLPNIRTDYSDGQNQSFLHYLQNHKQDTEMNSGIGVSRNFLQNYPEIKSYIDNFDYTNDWRNQVKAFGEL